MMSLDVRLHRRCAAGAFAVCAVGVVLLTPKAAAAQTAAALFERAQAQEQQLGEIPAAEALRRVAKAYQEVVRAHPSSAFCDNALWQAGALLERAWQRFAEPRDRDETLRVFAWLAKEYPGSLARQATARVAALKAAPSPAGLGPEEGRPAPPLPPPPSSPATSLPRTGSPVLVRNVTRTPLPKGDRITVELSAEATYTGQRVASPDRIFFDFDNATAAASLTEQARALQSPLIRTVRVGSPTRGVTRVVLELVGAPRYSAFFLYSPFRLVVDVETEPAAATSSAGSAAVPGSPGPSGPTSSPTPGKTTTSAAPTTSSPVTTPAPSVPPAATTTPAPTPPPEAKPQAVDPPAPSKAPSSDPQPSPLAPSSTGRGDYSLARQLGLRVAKIVIDPGHGGHDPGAIANGVTESELVLDIALRLKKLLEQTPGIEVVLTRSTNEFIPLEERTAIAKREHADLFLSIHANSHRQPGVSGIETYFLNFATNPDAEAVAARENAASVQTMGTLPAIVKAIALNDKLEESREFATLLQTNLMRRMRPQSAAIRDLGVKQAPFVVLIGAQMPSVLTEVAFLTNKTEAGLLKQPAHRQLIAQALRDAVVKYQDSLKRVSTTADQSRR